MDYPKYQVSRMDGEYQVVYRTEDAEEFSQFLAEIKKLDIKPVAPITKGYASTGNVNVTVDDFENKNMCPVHGVTMETKVSKKTNKPYKFHDVPDGRCFGKGALPPKF